MTDSNVKKFKQVCECKNCGNEAEMEITCTLEPEESIAETKVANPAHAHKHKGHAVCTSCGNEADMWVDLPQS
ncbi:Uncharacterized protein dnl_04110 [Desulfonema limicola]|uniref:Uncharacterized protein n=1 Tax=Desulfonema limicola TaxID=45656 RepID=A0A975GEJ8_9BACT|nr:hypothetical protein [Desulfonema limicola]QTA78195.1 Uncharacterized protein dnl_04110 [Desulfonema limicola]